MKKMFCGLLMFMLVILAGCQKNGETIDDENPLISINIVEENQSIQVGGTVQLTVLKNPTVNKDIIVWESLNPSVATVSSTGLVTGVAAGGTIIKAKNSTGSIFDTVIMTVTEGVPEVGVISWIGLEDTTVVAGNEVDLKKEISVIDSIDGDITDNVVILNDVDHEEELKANGWYNDYIEFEENLTGVYFVYYKIENSTGVIEYRSKKFIVEQGYNVVNGNFALRKSFWTLDAPGGTATWSVNEGEASVSIANSGTEWWAIQLMQTVSLKQGKTYKLSIEAKSPQEKTISFEFEDPTDGYRMLFGGINVQRLTTEYKTYDTYYTADKNYSSAKAVIYMGHMSDTDKLPSSTPDQVVIRRVKIEEVNLNPDVVFTVPANLSYALNGFTLDPNDTNGKPIFDPMAGVSASLNGENITDQIKVVGIVTPNILARTNYLLQYVVTGNNYVSYHTRMITVTMEKQYNWQIINDHFTSWLAGWTVDMNQTNAPGSSANFTQVSDGLSIEMVKKGTANWHMQIEQVGLKFEAGKTYEVEIRVKGMNLGANKKVTFEVAANLGSGFTTYGNAAQTVDLTEEFTTYSFEFTPSVNLNNARIGFQFGNINVGTVVILNYFTITMPE